MALSLNWLWRCFGWSGGDGTRNDANRLSVSLDIETMGRNLVIVKNGKRICGTGGAIANVPIVQNKAYFETRIQSSGIWGIGLGAGGVNLDIVPLGTCDKSWVLRHDGTVWHKNNEIYKMKKPPTEGDLVGVSYDHVDLKFYVNGQLVPFSVTGVKGDVYPLLYVDESAILEVSFTDFSQMPPSGYGQILIEQQIF